MTSGRKPRRKAQYHPPGFPPYPEYNADGSHPFHSPPFVEGSDGKLVSAAQLQYLGQCLLARGITQLPFLANGEPNPEYKPRSTDAVPRSEEPPGTGHVAPMK